MGCKPLEPFANTGRIMDQKIVAVNAYALQGDQEKCIEAGMDDYISKPIKMNELAEVLRKYQTT
jgi:CheY-like chemotaxis protein